MTVTSDELAAPSLPTPEVLPTPAGSAERSRLDKELIGAYSFLQLVTGVLAILLPVVVVAADWLIDDVPLRSIRGSISAYYYGRGGGWLVGTLCITAFFFLSYTHRWDPRNKTDFIVTKAASVAAFGVALFPTSSEGSESNLVSWIHYVSAFVLFSLLTFLVLYSFTKSEGVDGPGLRANLRRIFVDPKKPTLLKGKAKRNLLYRISGGLMAVTLCGSVVYALIENHRPSSPFLVLPGSWFFFVESFVVVLFGFIWLVKSQRFPALPKDIVTKA